MTKIKDGEYVLATKWCDGDPKDPWAFGFLSRIHCPNGGRINKQYRVLNSEGQFIGGRYRRAQRITKEFGDWLAKNIRMVEESNHSLWWWKQKANDFLK